MKISCHWIHQFARLFYLLVFISISQGNKSRTHRDHKLPNFLKGETNVTVLQGQTAFLRCRIRDLGTKKVQWRKIPDVFPLAIGPFTFSQRKDIDLNYSKDKDKPWLTSWTLVIKDTKPSDSGTYECKISTTQPYVYNVTLKVLTTKEQFIPTEHGFQDSDTSGRQISLLQPKKYKITLEGTEYVSSKQTINLTCIASGSIRAPVDIDWFHKGNIVHARDSKWNDRLKIKKYQPEVPGRSLVSQLIIRYSELEDGGNYVCRSSNDVTTDIDVHVLNDPYFSADKDNLKRSPPVDQSVPKESKADILWTNYVLLFLALLLSVT